MSKERQQDRIMHLLLSEGLAKQSPPDLSLRIFDRAFPEPSVSTLASLEPEDYSLPLPRISTLPTPKPKPMAPAEPDELDEPYTAKPARRPLIFRLARPLIAAAMLMFALGLFMYVNRPYPQPALAGDFAITGGGPVVRGAEVVTRQKTARLTLGGSYQVELAPKTRLTINGAPHAEAVTLQEGEIVCDLGSDLGDLVIKTEGGTVNASDARFRATLEAETASVGKGETTMSIHKKLLIAVFSGIVTVSGEWGQTSFAAGHEQAFTAAGPVAPAAATTPPPSNAATRIAGTIASVSSDAVGVQVSGGTTVSVGITPNTTIRLSDKAATLADLKPGMNVVIYITNTTTQIIASVPSAPKPPAPPAAINVTGTIAALADHQVTIQSSTKTTVVAVTDKTVIKIKDAVAGFGDLKTGMSILAITTDGKTATEIHAYAPTAPVPPTPTPPPASTIGGTVTQISGGQVTITDGGKDTILTFTDGTTFTVNGTAANAEAVKTGMHIYATTADGKTALHVSAYTPTPTPPPPTITVTGTIASIAEGQITIKTAAGTPSIAITSTTVIKVNGAVATIADLQAGMSVAAITTDGKTATEVRAYKQNSPPTPTPTPPPAVTTLTGTLSTLSATQVGVQSNGSTHILAVTANTIFKLNGTAVGRGDLKTGMSVAVLTGDGKTATEVRAYNTTTNPPANALTVNGVISQIAGTQVTVQDGTRINAITFNTATTFNINGAASNADALKVGMHISAIVTDGKVAKSIQAYTPTTATTPR